MIKSERNLPRFTIMEAILEKIITKQCTDKFLNQFDFLDGKIGLVFLLTFNIANLIVVQMAICTLHCGCSRAYRRLLNAILFISLNLASQSKLYSIFFYIKRLYIIHHLAHANPQPEPYTQTESSFTRYDSEIQRLVRMLKYRFAVLMPSVITRIETLSFSESRGRIRGRTIVLTNRSAYVSVSYDLLQVVKNNFDSFCSSLFKADC